ncbi:MAG: hypothetical protein AAGA00_03340 [Pseudomonadota bacterium]
MFVIRIQHGDPGLRQVLYQIALFPCHEIQVRHSLLVFKSDHCKDCNMRPYEPGHMQHAVSTIYADFNHSEFMPVSQIADKRRNGGHGVSGDLRGGRRNA